MTSQFGLHLSFLFLSFGTENLSRSQNRSSSALLNTYGCFPSPSKLSHSLLLGNLGISLASHFGWSMFCLTKKNDLNKNRKKDFWAESNQKAVSEVALYIILPDWSKNELAVFRTTPWGFFNMPLKIACIFNTCLSLNKSRRANCVCFYQKL